MECPKTILVYDVCDDPFNGSETIQSIRNVSCGMFGIFSALGHGIIFFVLGSFC